MSLKKILEEILASDTPAKIRLDRGLALAYTPGFSKPVTGIRYAGKTPHNHRSPQSNRHARPSSSFILSPSSFFQPARLMCSRPPKLEFKPFLQREALVTVYPSPAELTIIENELKKILPPAAAVSIQRSTRSTRPAQNGGRHGCIAILWYPVEQPSLFGVS